MEKQGQEVKILLLPKDPLDKKNILLEIRAGTGGDEASLFETFDLSGAGTQPAWAKALFQSSELFRLSSLRLDWFGFGAQADPLGRNQRAI